MDYSKLIIPGLVLALQFTMKLVVGRGFEAKTTVQAICELPVALIFLAISFSLVFLLTTQIDVNHLGLVTFISFIILALIITALSRHTIKMNDSKKNIILLFFLIFLNFTISATCIYSSTNVMVEKLKKDQNFNVIHPQKLQNVK